eukprot:TRINITY_DN43251_c0_g1_i1.p1 TRINITY_DN43251_c0_g1~~TRINITY_DN43251_c0_g1_i1.p1  ORF type:complete len:346 (+),score=144.23 TRINITY_DN43251_c0_g1_i1:80-1039(+)
MGTARLVAVLVPAFVALLLSVLVPAGVFGAGLAAALSAADQLGGVPWWKVIASFVSADVSVIVALGKMKLFRLQAAVTNLTVIIPANVLTTLAYFILTPLRLLWVQFETMLFTRVISIFTLKPSFWSANYNQLLDAFPLGYKVVLDLAKDKVPTDEILDMPAGSEEARDAIRAAAESPLLSAARAEIAKLLPSSVVQSFLFNVGFVILAQPLLVWWLCGPAYLPFVSASSPDSSERGNAVHLQLPKCKFLVEARKKYGDEKGWTACNNECMLGMEELFAGDHGLLDGRWEVRPDKETAACTFCMFTGGAKVKDIEDIVA